MILLTGESHLGAVRRGAPDRADVTYWPLGKGSGCATPFFVHDEDNNSVTTTVNGWRNRTFSKGTTTFEGKPALIGVSMPFNTSRILREYSWNTHVPWHLQKSDNEKPMSDALISHLMEQDYKYAVAFIAALGACGLSVFAIEAPRFFESGRVKTGRRKDRFFQRARLDVISYLDGKYRADVRAKLEDMGVDVIEQPSSTLTSHGSTKPKYGHEDPRDTHHANPAFGTIMFKNIIKHGKKAGAL